MGSIGPRLSSETLQSVRVQRTRRTNYSRPAVGGLHFFCCAFAGIYERKEERKARMPFFSSLTGAPSSVPLAGIAVTNGNRNEQRD